MRLAEDDVKAGAGFSVELEPGVGFEVGIGPEAFEARFDFGAGLRHVASLV